jgi:hypothetical protein
MQPSLGFSFNGGTGAFLYNKEGITQGGDPLSMFANGIAMLPLIRLLKVKFPTVEQTCLVQR